MYYEINVTQHGTHYFATAPRSITTREKAHTLLSHFQDAFPRSEGYKITVRHCMESSVEVTFADTAGQPIK